MGSVKFSTNENSLNNSRAGCSKNRTVKASKNKKFLTRINKNTQRMINIKNFSTNRSIGGEIRESIPTKTMTKMKSSFESNENSDHLVDYLHSKMSQSILNDIHSSVDSEGIVVSIELISPIEIFNIIFEGKIKNYFQEF